MIYSVERLREVVHLYGYAGPLVPRSTGIDSLEELVVGHVVPDGVDRRRFERGARRVNVFREGNIMSRGKQLCDDTHNGGNGANAGTSSYYSPRFHVRVLYLHEGGQ